MLEIREEMDNEQVKEVILKALREGLEVKYKGKIVIKGGFVEFEFVLGFTDVFLEILNELYPL